MPRGRRAHGEGGIRERTMKRKDGSSYKRWQAVVTAGFQAGRQKQVYGPLRQTKKEALADLDGLRKERKSGALSTRDTTLGEYLDYWLEQIKPSDDDRIVATRRQIGPKTWVGFEGDVRNHIKPYLGKVKLARLEPVVIQAWQKQLETEKSPYVARNASSALSTALSRAVAWRYLDRSPYEGGGVVKVALPEKEAEYWEPSEAAKFIMHEAVREHPFYVGYYLTMNLGFRIGELRGLRWEDITYLRNRRSKRDEPHIHVQRQAVGDRLVPVLSPRLKTKNSDRHIPLPSNALALLEDWRAQQEVRQELLGDAFLAPGALLTNELGGIPTTGHLRDEFYRLCGVVEVRKIKFHGLRHTAGSLWLEAGVPLMRVSRWLGHSTVRTTEKVYIHLIREASYGESINLEQMLDVG